MDCDLMNHIHDKKSFMNRIKDFFFVFNVYDMIQTTSLIRIFLLLVHCLKLNLLLVAQYNGKCMKLLECMVLYRILDELSAIKEING